MSESNYLFLTGENVLLPGHHTPSPATIRVDVRTGKIADVAEGVRGLDDFSAAKGAQVINAGKNYILPGLVE